jgi:SAM-dependent methyltransferase
VNDADLSGSQFNDANLSGSSFNQINFSGASFNDSNMSGWHVNDVNLSGAQIQNVNLSGARLDNCRLAGVTIDGVPVEEMLAVYRQLAKSIPVRCIGWDISPYAIQSAKALASSAGLSEDQVRFEVVDALGQIDPAPQADVVMNSLFMHHFEESAVVSLLTRSAQLARVAVVADDLNRTQLGWFLAKTGCWLLSRSPVVHFDGPQSVRAAFNCTEIASIAERAGLVDARLKKHWPERYALVWRRPPVRS